MTRRRMAQTLTTSTPNDSLLQEWNIRIPRLDTAEGTQRFDIYVCLKPMLTFIGNRICVGRYFADNSVYMAIASILSVFDIAPSRDSTGQVIPVEAAFQSGFFSWVLHYWLGVSISRSAVHRLVDPWHSNAWFPHDLTLPKILFFRSVDREVEFVCRMNGYSPFHYEVTVHGSLNSYSTNWVARLQI